MSNLCIIVLSIVEEIFFNDKVIKVFGCIIWRVLWVIKMVFLKSVIKMEVKI